MNSFDLRTLSAAAATLAATVFPFHLLAQQDASASISESEQATPAEPTKVGLIRFSGTYLDLPEGGGDLTAALLGGGVSKPKDFYEMVGQLEKAATSDEYDTILVDLTRGFSINSVQLREVARVLAEVRDAGKKTVAYFESASSGSYHLAAGCDEVVMADMGVVDFASPALSTMFLRDAFELLGVRMDVVRCGEFKGAVEPYLNSRMSDHLRDHYLAMLETMNEDFLGYVRQRRNVSRQDLRAMQGDRLLIAKDAKDKGLVDKLVTWEGAEQMMRDRFEGDIEFVEVLGKKKRRSNFNPMTEMLKLFNPKDEDEEIEEPTIAILHLSGTIIDGHKAQPGSIVSGPVVETIRELHEDELVRGVVLRINSPGGSATASEAILLALRDLAADKDVVVSMGTLAASGGYYVTCLGRPIFAEAPTITGSIGVFGMKPNMGPLFRRIGLHEEVVALDDSATISSAAHGWSDDQKGRIQAMVDSTYDRFIGHVAASRRMARDQVLAIAGGRVWSGEQAKAVGLVDEIGGLDAAIARAAEDAGLEKGAYEVVHLPKPKDFFEVLAQEMLQAKALLGLGDPIRQALLQRPDIESALQIIVDALSPRPTQVWAMVPHSTLLR